MQYALCLGVVAVLGYGCFHVIRKRIESRNQSEFDIPNFLSGRSDPGDYTSRRVETEWIEFLPSRNRK
jgi:hypothetical protein